MKKSEYEGICTPEEMMELMVKDWTDENADEMSDLVLDDRPYYNEDLDCWAWECHDDKTSYTLIEHDGFVYIEY